MGKYIDTILVGVVTFVIVAIILAVKPGYTPIEVSEEILNPPVAVEEETVESTEEPTEADLMVTEEAGETDLAVTEEADS